LSQVFHAVPAQGSGRSAAADQTGRDISVDLVDEALCKERCMHLAATLDEQAEHAAFTELVQQRRQRDSTVGSGGQAYHLGGSYAPRARRGDQRIRTDDLGRLAEAKLRIDDDAQGLAGALTINASRQLRVVGDHCVDANHDRVVHVPQTMTMGARLFSCDPA